MNNDRFKFRVWWEKRNRYLYKPVLIFGKVGSPCEIFEEGKLTQCIPTEETKIEQCTGIKDKHGNLIYESDIVKLDSGAIYKIIWRYNGFRYCGIKDPQNQRTLYYDDFDFTKVSEIPALKCEIIGNVHTEEQNKINERIRKAVNELLGWQKQHPLSQSERHLLNCNLPCTPY